MSELTRCWRETVKARLARDPAFVDAMLDQFEEMVAEIIKLDHEVARLQVLLKTAGPQGAGDLVS